MPTCHIRWLPTSRPLRYGALRVHLQPDPAIHFSNSTIARTTFAERLSNRSFVNGRPSKWREFGKENRKTRMKEKKGESKKNWQDGYASAGSPPSDAFENDSTSWIDSLETLLPPHLQSSTFTGKGTTLSVKEKSATFTKVIAEVRQFGGGTDVLVELGIRLGRWRAVLSIVDTVIAVAASRIPSGPPDQLPSNLDWPTSTPLEQAALEPILIERISSSTATGSDRWDELRADGSFTDDVWTEKFASVKEIWMSVGAIVLEASDLPPEQSNQVMSYAYQIIARLHNADCIPHHVYSYVHTNYDSTVRRPPIMHLLSSRILTTLSDAVWRAHQDEVIARAVQVGASHRDLVNELPGGRFRLKVRDLGAEVWLEFILWCCADGGYASAGAWIVERMRSRNNQNPWFAARWTSASGNGVTAQAAIDWARVKMRHGGSVGRVEGYSRERPVVEMESRTISVEVVLALIEATLNSRSPSVAGRRCTQDPALTSISNLLMFLEPHGLPQKYFDYLTVRLLEPALFDFEHDPRILQKLLDTVRAMRAMETTNKPGAYLPSLKVDSVLEQSEVFAGVLHQALETFVLSGRIHPTVEIFHEIQELVDQSKLRSIGSFLQNPQRTEKDFFSIRDFTSSQEYTSSHGQLSLPKLAAFLDLVTDAGLFEFGEWLIYSMDVDGPLIPLTLYNQSSLCPSILRFAGATQDHILIKDVVEIVQQKPLKPSVSFLRRLTDSRTQLKDFEGAGKVLAELNKAKGGGNDLSNIATLIATIIRLEKAVRRPEPERATGLLYRAISLLEWLLRDDFRGIIGDFRKAQIKDYQLAVTCLLRVVEAIPGSLLTEVARSWLPRLNQTNVVGLDAWVFDIVLSAVVETKGARLGMTLWNSFCEAPECEGGRDQKMVGDGNRGFLLSRDGSILQKDALPSVKSEVSSQHIKTPDSIGKSPSATSMLINGEIAAICKDMTNPDRDTTDAIGNENELSFITLDCDIGEATRDDARLASPTELVNDAQSLKNHFKGLSDLIEVKEPSSTPTSEPPSASISLPFPAEFREMISEVEVSSSPSHDDVVSVSPSALDPAPVVRPTFHTLRIIVQMALEELEVAKRLTYAEDPEVVLNITELPSKANMRALEEAMSDIEAIERWARPLFRSFGLDGNEIAVEFDQPCGDKGNVFSTEELRKKFGAARTEYEIAKMGMLGDMSDVGIRKRSFGPSNRRVPRKKGEDFKTRAEVVQREYKAAEAE